MRVAFISFTFGEYCVRQAAELARHADVLLVLSGQAAAGHESLLPPEVDFHSVEMPRLRQPWRQLARLREILRKVHAFKPDVVHFQHGHLWFNLALPRLRRYPLVVTVHDPRQHVGDQWSRKTPQAVMKFGYQQADRIIVHGQQLKEIVVSDLGMASDRVHVIPHVAIGERQGVAPVAEEEGTVLFFGRIWEYKGLDYLIRAEPAISAAVPAARIVIGGQGDDFARYERLMTHRERFEVHNRYVSDDERAVMFQRASVVVLPYIEATQSGVVPVAYSFGKPVVATNVGGLPEVVEDGRSGFLVPPRNETALADAVIRLLRDRSLRTEMGEAGRAKLFRDSSPEAVIQQTLDVYRRTIEDRRHSDQRPCHKSQSSNRQSQDQRTVTATIP
jgi:glycosyltransferase involved in cell wall biosynthesis